MMDEDPTNTEMRVSMARTDPRASAGAMTEAKMREADVPWPKSEEELMAYVRGLVDRHHDYGTCVYAMSMAAVATFRYVASALEVTGFQASCADMDILRRTRGLKHGFRLVDYGNLLYPRYWTEETTPIYRKVLADNPERWRDAATEALSTMSEHGSEAVREHLFRIATDPDAVPAE